MPNIKAAKKALRHNRRRRAVNDKWRRAYKVTVKTVHDALRRGDAAAALAAYPAAQRALDRTGRRNILHPRTVARQKSRLQKAIAKLQIVTAAAGPRNGGKN